MDESRISLKLKIYATLICCSVFYVVYIFSAFYAASLHNVDSVVLLLDKNIPFIPIFIIPYITSGIFFVLVPFLCKTKMQLRQYTMRIILLTLIAGLIFILFPLKFSFSKPQVSNSFLNFFFSFLIKFDSPFNQAPSLHVAYVFIYWSVLKQNIKGIFKYILKIWLILIVISTLLVYQHHSIDVFLGFIIAFIILIYTSTDKLTERNQYISQFYFLFASLFGLAFVLAIEYNLLVSFLFLWITAVIFYVGNGYNYNNSHFLKDKTGSISVWKKLFLFPYRFVYISFWTFSKKINKHKPIQIADRIFISARLTKSAAQKYISVNDYVVDLSAELIEIDFIKTKCNYISFPILDIGLPDTKKVENILKQLSQIYQANNKHQRILIHCTMGYSRSILLVILFLKKQFGLNTQKAIELVSQKSKSYVINKAALNFINQFKN